jgi:hypothetical protein
MIGLCNIEHEQIQAEIHAQIVLIYVHLFLTLGLRLIIFFKHILVKLGQWWIVGMF